MVELGLFGLGAAGLVVRLGTVWFGKVKLRFGKVRFFSVRYK